jgi:O-antigen/teichoic acid export membrane protein
MRHPLRRVATQGAWYAFGNALVKLSGLILLPVFTNTRYLAVADYGRWGVFEVTAQLAVALLGLSLGIGLVRFYSEPQGGTPAVSTAWWLTVFTAVAVAGLAGLAIAALVPAGMRPIYLWLLAYVVFEMLLAIPLALLRARERAGGHTAVQALKLGLLVALGLYFLVARREGLLGVVIACALSSAAAVFASLVLSGMHELGVPRISRRLTSTLLRFSVPLVVGGLGSTVLNAGDRYVLAGFRSAEEVAVYTLASKFGGIVNMFVVQPLNLAWLPLLFRLEPGQRPGVLRLLVPYLTFALCFVVVALSVLAGPVLKWIGSAASYGEAIPLLPWVAFGFAAYGLATVFSGILALFQQTRALSVWLLIAAALNLALNFALVPRLGALACALNTFLAYFLLFSGQYWTTRKWLPNRYPWGRLAGLTVVSFAAALAGALRPAVGSLSDWVFRIGLLAAWLGVLLLTRWFSFGELWEAWRVMRARSDATPLTAVTPPPAPLDTGTS